MIGAMVLGAARAAEAVAAVLGLTASPEPAPEPLPVRAGAEHARNGYLAGGLAGPVPLGAEPGTPAAPPTFSVADRLATAPASALGPLLFMDRPSGPYAFATVERCPACGRKCTWLAKRLDRNGKDLTWWDFGGECGCPATVVAEDHLLEPRR